MYESIGRFLCSFSNVEYELGGAIKVILEIQHSDRADAIIGALGDITRKINLVRSAIDFAQNIDKTPIDRNWVKKSKQTMNDILTINHKQRIFLAHAYLQITSDGHLKLTKLRTDGELKVRQEIWKRADLEKYCSDLDTLAQEVRAITTRLSTIVITVTANLTEDDDTLSASASVHPSAGTAPSKG